LLLPRHEREMQAKLKSKFTSDMKKMPFMSTPTPLSRAASGGFGAAKAVNDNPPTPMDRKMTVKHSQDSIKYNMRHANDHLAAAKKAKTRLAQVKKKEPCKSSTARWLRRGWGERDER